MILSILIGAILSTSTWLPPALAAEVTIDDVKRAWQARQDRTRSFRFEWTESQFCGAGTRSAQFWVRDEDGRRLHLDHQRNRQRLPLKDTVVEVRRSLVVESGKICFETDGPSWIGGLGRFAPRRSVDVFDGHLVKGFTGDPTPDDDVQYPRGFISMAQRLNFAQTPAFRPLMLSFRALDPELGETDLDGYTVSPRPVIVDGREGCILRPPSTSPGRAIYHLDPGRGYVVTRIIHLKHDTREPLVTATISYRDDPHHGPIPSAWKWIFLREGKQQRGQLRYQYAVEVTRYEINPALEPSQFQLDFPPGTYVQDTTNPKQPVFYLTRPGGTRRPVTEEERRSGATYSQLVATRPGEAVRPRTADSSLLVWLLGLSGFAVLMAVTAIQVRRRRSEAPMQ